MNIELLRQVQDWLSYCKAQEFNMEIIIGATPSGTACCIAGKGLLISGYIYQYDKGVWQYPEDFGSCLPLYSANEWNEAKKIFEINHEQALRLFRHEMWPAQFLSRCYGFNFHCKSHSVSHPHLILPTPTQGIARIEHFILTKGED